MDLPYCILAEAVKRRWRLWDSLSRYEYTMNLTMYLLHPGRGCQEGDGGCGTPYPGTLWMNLPYCILAEAVKNEIELWEPISRYAKD
jgi:hypothetical protein